MLHLTWLHTGSKEEWSLVRRHPSERNFGVQLAGAKPALLTKAAEVLTRTLGENGFQYANVNCGCPIDLVFQAGAGSAC
jgi:tRNA-dihydrouridine synthase 3